MRTILKTIAFNFIIHKVLAWADGTSEVAMLFDLRSMSRCRYVICKTDDVFEYLIIPRGPMYLSAGIRVHIYRPRKQGLGRRPENQILDKARFVLNVLRELKKVDVVKACAFNRAWLERAEESKSCTRKVVVLLFFITTAETDKRSLSTSRDSLTISSSVVFKSRITNIDSGGILV